MNHLKAAAEAVIFSIGDPVERSVIADALEITVEELDPILSELAADYEKEDRGMQLLFLEDSCQFETKKEYYEPLIRIASNPKKPSLTDVMMETLSIIAYNPKVTRAEIEAIRGVNSDGTIYKLLEYELIESAGKLDAPGRPTMYQVTNQFLKLFGIKNLDQLPELPRYKTLSH